MGAAQRSRALCVSVLSHPYPWIELEDGRIPREPQNLLALPGHCGCLLPVGLRGQGGICVHICVLQEVAGVDSEAGLDRDILFVDAGEHLVVCTHHPAGAGDGRVGILGSLVPEVQYFV